MGPKMSDFCFTQELHVLSRKVHVGSNSLLSVDVKSLLDASILMCHTKI